MALDSLTYDPDDKAVTGSMIDELQREREKLERMAKLIEVQIGEFANQFVFDESAYVGVDDGSTPTVVKIRIASGNGALIAVKDFAGVSAAVTGSAVIAESNPLSFVRTIDEDTGAITYEATINVTNAVAETVQVSLTDSEGTGLTLPTPVDIVYS